MERSVPLWRDSKPKSSRPRTCYLNSVPNLRQAEKRPINQKRGIYQVPGDICRRKRLLKIKIDYSDCRGISFGVGKLKQIQTSQTQCTARNFNSCATLSTVKGCRPGCKCGTVPGKSWRIPLNGSMVLQAAAIHGTNPGCPYPQFLLMCQLCVESDGS